MISIKTYINILNKYIIKGEINKKDLEKFECLIAQTKILEYCNNGGKVKLFKGKLKIMSK